MLRLEMAAQLHFAKELCSPYTEKNCNVDFKNSLVPRAFAHLFSLKNIKKHCDDCASFHT